MANPPARLLFPLGPGCVPAKTHFLCTFNCQHRSAGLAEESKRLGCPGFRCFTRLGGQVEKGPQRPQRPPKGPPKTPQRPPNPGSYERTRSLAQNPPIFLWVMFTGLKQFRLAPQDGWLCLVSNAKQDPLRGQEKPSMHPSRARAPTSSMWPILVSALQRPKRILVCDRSHEDPVEIPHGFGEGG